jgi:hypothetical protein
LRFLYGPDHLGEFPTDAKATIEVEILFIRKTRTQVVTLRKSDPVTCLDPGPAGLHVAGVGSLEMAYVNGCEFDLSHRQAPVCSTETAASSVKEKSLAG